MFGLGWLEVGVIAIVGVFIFGTKKIREQKEQKKIEHKFFGTNFFKTL